MKDSGSENPVYPGNAAKPRELLGLAEAYFEAANSLFENARKGDAVTYAPARLCAIHATELFLNAFLRAHGKSAGDVRARLHNLADVKFVETLNLRKKTAEHLSEMTHRREYLISRYAPELVSQHTELNRLQATLNEVRKKTTKFLREKA